MRIHGCPQPSTKHKDAPSYKMNLHRRASAGGADPPLSTRGACLEPLHRIHGADSAGGGRGGGAAAGGPTAQEAAALFTMYCLGATVQQAAQAITEIDRRPDL